MMLTRTDRAALAQETLAIIDAGCYNPPSGARVDIAAGTKAAVEGTERWRPDRLEALLAAKRSAEGGASVIEIRSQTTLEACQELADPKAPERVAALNFASAKKPGGGFINGALAQEETIARSSSLYPCLRTCDSYYDAHRRNRNAFYSDDIIVSPAVPIFRSDDGTLLEAPYRVTILTSAAVNAGEVLKRDQRAGASIRAVMRRRTAMVLALAARLEIKTLILGAWGCGVFRNDPEEIAGHFRALLLDEERFRGALEKVVFAIPGFDKDSPNLDAFEEVFEMERVGGKPRKEDDSGQGLLWD